MRQDVTALPPHPVTNCEFFIAATPRNKALPLNSRTSLPAGPHMPAIVTLTSTDTTQAAQLPGASPDIIIITSALLAPQKQVHILTDKVS